MIQGFTLSLAIFNGIVDVVVHHWVLLVAGGAEGLDGWRGGG